MHTRQAIARVAIAVIALATLAAGCKKDAGSGAAAMQRPPAAVMVAQAVTRDVPVYIDEVGRTAAIESVTIQPQVGGKITRVHFNDGADVEKGQVLFTIDPRPFQAALAEAEAELAEQRATLKWSKDEVTRVSGIRETGAVSAQEYEQKVNAVAVAEAKVLAADAKVATAKLNLEYCTIESPITGRAGQRLVDPGNVVTGGGMDAGTKLLVIQKLDPLYADFTVTENAFGTVRKFMADGRLPAGDPQGKMKVLVDIPGDARQIVEALGGPTTKPAAAAAAAGAVAAPALAPEAAVQAVSQPASNAPAGATTRPGSGPREGVLTFLDNAVQSATGTVRVRATLPNADRYFWPGQFVGVRLVLTVKQNAVLIPATAQQIGQEGPFVYVVEQGTIKDPATGKESAGTIAALRPVVPGQRQGDMLVIERGLQAGEQVVTQGHMMIMPGGPVMVIPPPGGAPGSAPGGAPAAASAAAAGGAGEAGGAGGAGDVSGGSAKKS